MHLNYYSVPSMMLDMLTRAGKHCLNAKQRGVWSTQWSRSLREITLSHFLNEKYFYGHIRLGCCRC